MPDVTAESREALLRLPLMDGVPEALGAEMAGAGRVRDLEAGDAIFAEGQPAARFAVILSGFEIVPSVEAQDRRRFEL